jgi:ABC-type proline/glycine betaine transport system permease subunit
VPQDVRQLRWAHKHIPEILLAVWQHLLLSVTSVLIGLAIALVLGIICARRPSRGANCFQYPLRHS